VKAIVYTAPYEVQLVEDWPEPVCGPTDVVVQMRAVGICGSDLALYDGHKHLPSLPWVLGHEGGGDIVAVGSAVQDRHLGQRVVIEPNFPCLECPACRTGVTSGCPRRAILGMNRPGILAERVAIPSWFAWPVPTSWPDEVLACFEPMAVARAAVRRSLVGRGDQALVVGAGSVGVFVALSLLAVGAVPYVTDPCDGRVVLAEALGARKAKLGGDTYPYVFETAGAPPAFGIAMSSLACSGTVTLIGLGDEPVQLSASDVVRRGLTISGSIIYDHPRDFADTRDALNVQNIRPERALNPGIQPDRAEAAFAAAHGVVGKSWIDLRSWHEETPEES